MSDRDTRRKGSARVASVLLAGWLALAVPLAVAGREPRAAYGVFSGTSLSLGKTFIDMNSGGHTDNHYLPHFIFGAYFQYALSEEFALQLNVNHQNVSNQWEFHYWDHTTRGKESLGAFSISLNGILTVSRTPMSRFYFLGGAGFLAGPFENLGALIQLAAGPGLCLRMKRGSPAFFNLAAIIHPVLYSYGRARQAVYLKLQAGVELELRDRKQKKEKE